eukprot:TRINITY_DN556_c0_g1_i2.p1 TRINITY_DN556_c0_g1~~TRINITY_DN556_c0_g1_i2.p1  ORF type:complete len:205 (+),score=22.46 TRINITY_DN556_c0_g1_i2:625-1239(+)
MTSSLAVPDSCVGVTTQLPIKNPTEPVTQGKTRPRPGSLGEEGEERDRKRHKGGDGSDSKKQKRLLQNRLSAARSRQRKKEYLTNLERSKHELEGENSNLKQRVYNMDQRIRALEQQLTIISKQNEELQILLKTSDKSAELERILSIYSSLPIPTALHPSQMNAKHDLNMALMRTQTRPVRTNVIPERNVTNLASAHTNAKVGL